LLKTRYCTAWLWSLGLLIPLTITGADADETPAAPAPPATQATPAQPAGTATPPATDTTKTPSQQIAQAPAAAGAAVVQQAPAEQKPAPPSLDVSGFIDVYYEYNFNRPPAFTKDAAGTKVKNDIENKLRNFDFKHNEFALNLAEVVIQKNPAPVGFHINLAFGKATDWIHAAEPGGNEVYKHLLQAYLTAPLKLWGKNDTLDVGKFVTPAGAEVIETKDNWNYTRSFLFSWAIPYYHMGLRYKHPFTDTKALTLFLMNGWNDVEDNNNALTYGVSFNTDLGKKLLLAQNWIGGPELNDDNKHWRHLFDTVLTYNATPKTSFIANFDYGRQELPGSDASWIGFAGYVRHALNDKNALVLRGEWFDDRDGFATGTNQTLNEVTLTYEMKHSASLLTRVEGRYDWSDKEVFDKRGGSSKHQPTLLVGAVYMF
jgi:hypothetical protein